MFSDQTWMNELLQNMMRLQGMSGWVAVEGEWC